MLWAEPLFLENWPSPLDLEAWIHPRYWAAFRRGSLRTEFCHRHPFEYAFFADFFRTEIIEKIDRACREVRVERARTDGIARHADWYWGPFDCLPVLRMIYGTAFRRFLNELMDSDLTMRAKCVPQYNVFRPGSRGIPLHTDAEKGQVNVVSLLQLSKTYPQDGGGELCFFRRTHPGFQCVEKITPVLNTLILFKVSSESLHSVADLKGDWTRENIAFDWFYRDQTLPKQNFKNCRT